jgi:hypothetical protein
MGRRLRGDTPGPAAAAVRIGKFVAAIEKRWWCVEMV